MALRIGDLTEATSFVGTDVFELSLAGSAGSRRVTGSNLRKQLFAGGTGFTSTDPLQAGNTTITGTAAISGTLGVTGAATFSSTIAVTGSATFSSTINSQTISATANFTGTVTVATGLTVSAGGITVTGNSTITGTLGGITTLTATTLAGTLSTAAQPNVTSVGTLTSLTVSGLTSASGSLRVGGTASAGADNTTHIANNAGQAQIWAAGTGVATGTMVFVVSLANLTSSTTAVTITASTTTISTATTAVQALTATSLTVSGDAKGSFWRAEGTPAGSGTGVGLEAFVSGTEAYLQAYNRTTAAVATMYFNGSSYRFLTNAVTIDSGLTVSAGTTAVQALTATTGVFSTSVTAPVVVSSTTVAGDNAVTASPTHATYTGTAFRSAVSRAANSAFYHFFASSNGVMVASVDGTGAMALAAGITATSATFSGALSVGSTAQVNGRLLFGGATSAHTAIDRSSTTIQMLLGDGSAYTAVQMAALTATTGTFSGAITATNITGSGQVSAGAASYFAFTGRSVISSASDGVMLLSNNAVTDFTRLQFGGTTSAFPSLKRNGTGLDLRTADDTAYGAFQALTVSAWGTAQSLFMGIVNIGGMGTGGTIPLLALTNVTAAVSLPTGGGYLYADAGALKWRGSSGTITTIAPA